MDFKIQKKDDIKNIYKKYLEFGIYLLVILGVFYLVTNFVAQITKVEGSSMNSTLNDKDSLLLEKVTYAFGNIKRFDIVVFPYSEDPSINEVNYIKRVIGLPGETIQIKDGIIYIDGEELKEDYGYYEKDIPMKGYLCDEEYVIGDNEYFVLGDNRNNSKDSRKIGCIRGDVIIGKAVFRLFPLSDIGLIK